MQWTLCVCVHSVVSDSFTMAWTVAHQAPLSMGVFRQEEQSGLLFLLQGICPTQGLNVCLLHCRQILYYWAIGEAPNEYCQKLKELNVQNLYLNFIIECLNKAVHFLVIYLILPVIWRSLLFVSFVSFFSSSLLSFSREGEGDVDLCRLGDLIFNKERCQKQRHTWWLVLTSTDIHECMKGKGWTKAGFQRKEFVPQSRMRKKVLPRPWLLTKNYLLFNYQLHSV